MIRTDYNIYMDSPKKKMTLALSGGGARGIAHIGILKVLAREHIPFHAIVGTSFGGFMGAALATGISPLRLEEEALRISQTKEFIKLLDPNPLRKGLLDGVRVKNYIERLLGSNQTFEKLIFPLKMVAVDLSTGEEVLLDHGDLLHAVFATIAIPGIFNPVEYEGRLLVDGGVMNNLPVNHARQTDSDIVLAVDVQPYVGPENPWDYSRSAKRFIPDAIISMYRAEVIQSSRLTKEILRTAPPDILIHPDIPDEIDSLFGFRFAREILAAGEAAAELNLSKIRALLS